MIKKAIFTYFHGTNVQIDANRDTFTAVLPKGIAGVTELFNSLFEKLLLPGYFGFNWNALSDCLRDFHWIKEKNIILIHQELPSLPLHEFSVYLHVLYECVEDWSEDDGHHFIVMFSEDAKESVIKALSAE